MTRLSFAPTLRLLACTAFAALVFAGCLGNEEPNPSFAATATDGVLFTSWDYAGETKTPLAMSLEVDVDADANTGLVRAGGRMGNDTVTVELTEFVHDTNDFHSGGIAANFDEHGDTGVGNALLPKMHLLIATWGPGQVMVAGNATKDPYTGGDVWDAHLMVTSTGVREGDKVTKADGTTPFDPATAGDARIGDDLEAHLVLTSRYTNESLAPFNLTESGTLDATTGRQSFPVTVPIHEAHIVVTIDFGDDPGETGPYQISLVDPNGTAQRATTVNRVVPTAPGTAVLEHDLTMAGDWTIVVSSVVGDQSRQIVPADFTLDVLITYPPKPMWYFFWEDVDVDQRVVG